MTTSLLLHAQDKLVTEGLKAYQQYDYTGAIKSFDQALKNPYFIKKERNKVQAYVRRASSYRMVIKKSPEHAQPDYPMKAQEDLKKATQYDTKGDFVTMIKLEKDQWASFLTLFGTNLLNAAYGQKSNPQQQQATYKGVVQYMEVGVWMDETNYMNYDLMGQSQLQLRDSVSAYTSFQKSILYYDSHPPANPDPIISYAYYRMAMIERYGSNDPDKALETILKGETLLKREYERFKGQKGKLTTQAYATLDQRFADAMQDLERFRLDLYLVLPGKLKEAIADFEKQVQGKDKNNVIMRLAYGQLLESAGRKEDAIQQYQAAVDIDPANTSANFNLGTMYFNQASAHIKKGLEAEDYAVSEKENKAGQEIMAKAYPYFQKVQQIEPCDIITLRTLMSISMTLQKMDDYKAYKEKTDDCGG